MADAVEIVARIRARGANVEVVDDGLRIINRAKLPSGGELFIAQNKTAIAAYLRDEAADESDAIEERASIIEFDGNTPREWAEQFARLLIRTRSDKIDRFALPWFLDRCGEIIDAAPLKQDAAG